MPGRRVGSSSMPPSKRPGRQGTSSNMPPGKRRRSQGGPAVPPLPPKIADDDIDISDEDLEYVRKHKDYAGFLANLDTKTITRQVLGLKEGQDDDLETYYEKVSSRSDNSIQQQFSVDPVDVLPVKTLEGELRYRSTSTANPVDGTSISLDERRAIVSKTMNKHHSEKEAPSGVLDSGPEEKEKKKTKAERRQEAKLMKKKLKLEAGTQQEGPHGQETVPSIADEELDVEEEDVSPQERGLKLKSRMAEIGIGLFADPEGNIMTLKELQDLCVDRDESISQLAMLSSMAIFKDLIPGYRIRLPTEKEIEMTVSKEVRKLRDYETALLRFYQAFVQMLVRCAKVRNLRRTALRCLCGLLEAVPHFNYRDSILSAVVPRMNSDDDDCSYTCCQAVVALFKNPGKHGGEATVEAVQLIADLVRLRNCHCRSEVIEVLLDLVFDGELLRDLSSGAVSRSSKEGDQKKLSKRQEKKEKKAKKRELAAELRKGVEADFKEASAVPGAAEHRKLQTSTLSAVFETYFRILKRSIEPLPERTTTLDEMHANRGIEQLGSRPLLRSCLDGLAKFSHLINVDFMSDLLGALRALASGGKSSSESAGTSVSVWERLQCCTVAFKIVRLNMDALNIDLREFYVLFYNLLLETISIREGEKNGGETLAQALQIMLWEGSHSDMSRVTAFVKRLSFLALHLRSGEAVAVLATVQHLLVRYKKCRNILDGALGSSILMLESEECDPDLHEAGSTVLWELSLLAQHYNPEVSKYAATLSTMNKSSSIVMPTVTPTAAVREFSSLLGSLNLPLKVKRKKQIRPDRQPKSDFFASLENKLLSTEETSAPRKLFTSHFRFIKASQKHSKVRQELPMAKIALSR